MINVVKKKTFPFSINELKEEIKAQEELKNSSDELFDTLDAKGLQENDDLVDEPTKEIVRPIIDFSEWHDDILIN